MIMVESWITPQDKMLISLALILLLTIVWTILIGIIYKMNENKYEKTIIKKSNEDDKKKIKSPKRRTKSKSNLETYVKIRYYRTKSDLIYIAPKNVTLLEGQKIKVKVDDNTIKSATVIKGNYTREKYKKYKYVPLELEK